MLINQYQQQTNKFVRLDQYDYFDEEYIESVKEEYACYIGLFLINFSSLEHDLNVRIAEIVNERSHDLGYYVIEKLTLKNKIDLFCKLRHRKYTSTFGDNLKNKLKLIENKLNEINSFRNIIVHANWPSLTKDKYVRSKIMVDNEEAEIKFKTVKFTPLLIKQKIKEMHSVQNEIEKFEHRVDRLCGKYFKV